MNSHPDRGACRLSAVTLLVLSVVCAVLACSKDTSAPANSPETVVDVAGIPAELRPDITYIIIRDLEGYYADCGCTGTAVGGIQRLPALAKPLGDVIWVFAGRTFSRRPSERDTPVMRQVHLRQSAGMVPLAGEMFRELGTVLLAPDEAELAELPAATSLAQRFATPDAQGSFGETGQGLGLENGAVTWRGKRVAPLTDIVAHARQALVLCVWNSDALDSWRRSAELGPAIRESLQQPSASSKLSDALGAGPRTAPAVTWWSTNITAQLAEDPGIRALQKQSDLSIAHGPSSGVVLPIKLTRDEVLAEWQSCAACHEPQFKAWSQSRHVNAYLTLASKGRAADLSCIHCHIQEATGSASDLRVSTAHAAVTCMTCHEPGRGRVSTGTCVQCHTAITDPEIHYGKWFDTVCSKGLPIAGECARQAERARE